MQNAISHNRSLLSAKSVVKGLKLDCLLLERGKKYIPDSIDLIITLGGDGTLLEAAHFAGNVPILAVNSMPEYSVGFFCIANASNLESVLRKIQTGKLRPKKINLLEAKIGNKKMMPLAVNDILVTKESPAETLSYSISIGKKRESQRSSGVWVSTSAGSTGGIGSAGGKRMKLAKKGMQYLIREPMKRYDLHKGFVGPNKTIEIIPETDKCFIYIDGNKNRHHVPLGERLSIRNSESLLNIFI
ncbi:MAG: NAD(+)/NADH kinase [Pseudomonadota bacterium]